MAAIVTKELSKEFRLGIRRKKCLALDQLNLEVQEGEVFGFLGPNGAGKTTTLKILMGFIKPSHGTGFLFGEEIGTSRIKHRIGFLPESPYFYDYLTATEFLSFYGRLFSLSQSVLKKRIKLLLAQVGLEHAKNLQLRKFSKGMLQRIGIAQALINDPELIILDEPMSGLDPIGRKEVRDLISELKEQGKTVFFSSHIIPDVEMLCDRVAILVGGQLQDIGHLNEILETQVKYIEVVIRGLDESSVRSLEPFSEGYFQTGDRFVVRIMNEEDLEKVFNTAINFKGRIVSVSPVKETLEEHFIRKSKKARSV